MPYLLLSFSHQPVDLQGLPLWGQIVFFVFSCAVILGGFVFVIVMLRDSFVRPYKVLGASHHRWRDAVDPNDPSFHNLVFNPAAESRVPNPVVSPVVATPVVNPTVTHVTQLLSPGNLARLKVCAYKAGISQIDDDYCILVAQMAPLLIDEILALRGCYPKDITTSEKALVCLSILQDELSRYKQEKCR